MANDLKNLSIKELKKIDSTNKNLRRSIHDIRKNKN